MAHLDSLAGLFSNLPHLIHELSEIEVGGYGKAANGQRGAN
jgi:hypothetical protein